MRLLSSLSLSLVVEVGVNVVVIDFVVIGCGGSVGGVVVIGGGVFIGRGDDVGGGSAPRASYRHRLGKRSRLETKGHLRPRRRCGG